MSLAGYLHDVYLGAVSIFYVMILIQSFFGPGTYAIIGPYMTELWPAPLRASGLGLAYGTSNLGKFIGPLGLALIAGTSNYVNPQATSLETLVVSRGTDGSIRLVPAVSQTNSEGCGVG
jgi:hypothetical protein